jgi:DNA-binding MarR family transcriptional regulator
MPLTNSLIRCASSAERPFRLSDGGGLYLLINPDGSRWWRLDYRHAGKRKTLSMGIYPDTGLIQARQRRGAASQLLARGQDPGEVRRLAKSEAMSRPPHHVTARTGDRYSSLSQSRPLDILGIEPMEESAYRALLMHRLATADDLAHTLDMPGHKVQRLLDRMESKGLASHSPERPRRYIAAPPELAVEALVVQRQADLERARSMINEIKEQSLQAADESHGEQVVELITSRTALDQAIRQLLQTVKTDLMTFQRAPVLYSEGFPGSDGNLTLPKGVRARSISDAEFMALPRAFDSLRRDVESGEEQRIFPVLPVKMIVADDRIGLIPLHSNPNSPVLLVRASSLLDSLRALFELIWERSTPVVFGVDGQLGYGICIPNLSDAARQVIPLLAAGLNDKAIAYEAGISINTLTRRIAELMKCFDTRTRFQLGWQAAFTTFQSGVAHGVSTKPPTKKRLG